MTKSNPVRSGLLLLVVGGVIGYGVGLGLDAVITGNLDFSGSVSGLFALLFAVTAFFFGVFGYRGITRGLVWQVVGTIIGGLFVTAIRFLMGSRGAQLFGNFFFSEPAWVFGALTGVISFLFGVGVLDDWVKWVRGIDTPEHHEDVPGWEKYFG